MCTVPGSQRCRMSSPDAAASASCSQGLSLTGPPFLTSSTGLCAQLFISEREHSVPGNEDEEQSPWSFLLPAPLLCPFSLPTHPPSFSYLIVTKSLGVWSQYRNHILQLTPSPQISGDTIVPSADLKLSSSSGVRHGFTLKARNAFLF